MAACLLWQEVKEQTRLQCEGEKQALTKQFEQRIAGQRLEKEQVAQPPPGRMDT